jgi:hypothetical protein
LFHFRLYGGSTAFSILEIESNSDNDIRSILKTDVVHLCVFISKLENIAQEGKYRMKDAVG